MLKSFALFVLLISFNFCFAFETVTFPSQDGLQITADVYIANPDSSSFIVLFHRARWSRGEYREIAPELNKMGFNCMAIDQRSGDAVNNVDNETVKHAKEKKMDTNYLAALPDLQAAINYAKKNYAQEKLIIWGSSYSAALVLKIAGDSPDEIDGVLAFAPGEYFGGSGKSDTYITNSAKNIKCPVFITSAKSEKSSWWKIYEAISAPKSYFLPETGGVHGSESLWKKTPENKEYWGATVNFLKKYFLR